MIVFKKYRAFDLSLLSIMSLTVLLQAAENNIVSKRWPSPSKIGVAILKHPVTPYALAPLASYTGMTLGSKIIDVGSNVANHLPTILRFAPELGAIGLGGISFIVPSLIPLSITAMQRKQLNIDQRPTKLHYFGPALIQALSIGALFAYDILKRDPHLLLTTRAQLLAGTLSASFIGCAPGLLWGIVGKNLEEKRDAIERERQAEEAENRRKAAEELKRREDEKEKEDLLKAKEEQQRRRKEELFTKKQEGRQQEEEERQRKQEDIFNQWQRQWQQQQQSWQQKQEQQRKQGEEAHSQYQQPDEGRKYIPRGNNVSDWYKALELNRDDERRLSQADQITNVKTAYRTLAKRYHPDRNAGNKEAESKFKEVDTAYQGLLRHFGLK